MTASLCLYRFSDRPGVVADFLTLVGLRPAVTGGSGFAVLRGASGAVAVHATSGAGTGAAPGETQLSFDVPDAAAAARAFEVAGIPARLWDEAYGRHAAVREPRGGDVVLNEEDPERYGYRTHDAAGSRVSVVAVVYTDTDTAAAERDFFAVLGYAPTGPAGEWQELRSRPGDGVVGLHAPGPGARAVPDRAASDTFGLPALADLSLTTTEPLEELAARLRAAGHGDARIVVDGVRKVHVTDPDGLEIEIHPAG